MMLEVGQTERSPLEWHCWSQCGSDHPYLTSRKETLALEAVKGGKPY